MERLGLKWGKQEKINPSKGSRIESMQIPLYNSGLEKEDYKVGTSANCPKSGVQGWFGRNQPKGDLVTGHFSVKCYCKAT